MAYSEEVKKEAIRLRVEERLTLSEIAYKLGGISAVSNWLKDIKLTDEELKDRKQKRVITGKKHSQETKNLLRYKLKKYYEDPENRRRAGNGNRGKKLSNEQKAKLSEIHRKLGSGGFHSRKSVRYTTIEGKEIFLHSSWEEKVAIELDKNNISWNRPSKRFKWIDTDGKIRSYLPDFYLIDYRVYLDPKNDYLIVKDKYKIEKVQEMNNIKVVVLSKKMLSWKEIYRAIA